MSKKKIVTLRAFYRFLTIGTFSFIFILSCRYPEDVLKISGRWKAPQTMKILKKDIKQNNKIN